MPFKSKAQQRWAYANEDKPTKEGKAARSFVKHSKKQNLSKLPEYANDDEQLLAVVHRHIGR